MRISLLEIKNFRGIKQGQLQFRGHTVIIGPNNSCKTTIIEALALVLGRDRLIRTLTEHDFFESTPQPNTRISITATVTGFEPEDFTQHPDWFGDRRAVPAWFDPDNGRVLPEQANARQLLACQMVFAARFNAETLEVETVRYFNDSEDRDVFEEDNFVSVPPKLIRDVGFFLVPASRSWDRMLSFSSELFRRVIRMADGLPATTVLDERDKLRRPAPKLEDDTRLAPVVAEVDAEMARLFGRDIPLRLRITATDSASVLEAITPHFQTGGQLPVPAKRQGSGLVSLQSLFLLLHFGQRRIADGESFFMALEEPELHLPPAVQRRVLARLQALSTQTIVTTHSPLVAGYCDATSLLIVRNNEGILDVRPMLAKPLEQEATNAVRRLFQINRVETAAAMMNDYVLVPEGRLDFDWLTLLLRVAEVDRDGAQPCLFGVRVGVVPTTDAKVKETCEVLSKAHPMVCALVDGDAEGKRYADLLDAPTVGAKRVLLWPDGWTIEDVIGWIIQADEAVVIARLNADLAVAPGNRATLVTRLKSVERGTQGLKGDGVAYEVIANSLSESAACRNRTRVVLHAIAEACAGAATPRFQTQTREQGQISRLVFTP
ncbi:AAA family ATPase [Bradyrhizobium arachidis]|uniref:ATP-dependent nuclease n=1 Tax=Bradyrhizobium TaxID=374 RepID=UPI0021626895|nr:MULTISPECIES: AAA family ATPase [Bradyrhizobium]MDN4986408.1 AAA family ATPase [Bradyrhizobium sp. WYCCWR 13022]UVO38255.1 AAA family ATPase [Bradyrhizobium arachidis]